MTKNGFNNWRDSCIKCKCVSKLELLFPFSKIDSAVFCSLEWSILYRYHKIIVSTLVKTSLCSTVYSCGKNSAFHRTEVSLKETVYYTDLFWDTKSRSVKEK